MPHFYLKSASRTLYTAGSSRPRFPSIYTGTWTSYVHSIAPQWKLIIPLCDWREMYRAVFALWLIVSYFHDLCTQPEQWLSVAGLSETRITCHDIIRDEHYFCTIRSGGLLIPYFSVDSAQVTSLGIYRFLRGCSWSRCRGVSTRKAPSTMGVWL